MNKIEKLIEDLSPDGVLQVRLGTAITESTSRNSGANIKRVRSVTNSNGLVDTNEYWENSRTSADTSNYKVVRPGMFVYNPSRINVGSISWNKENKEVIVSPMYVVFGLDETLITTAYLMHFFSSSLGKKLIESSTEQGARFRLPFENLAKLLIQIPPVRVQQEIVSILDKFTELEAELEAELDARNSQYAQVAYLQIKEAEERSLKSQKLAEVADIFDGTHQTPTYTDSGVRFVSVENIANIYGSPKCISSEAFQNDFKVVPRPGDVFMTRIGSVGKAAVVQTEEPLAYYVSLALIRPNQEHLNPEYLKHWLASPIGINELRKWTLLSATPVKINLGDIGRLQIKLPPIDIQAQVSEYLDKLEALFTDSSMGLPAEIQARRKQYEYYRNKLLIFKEVDEA